MIFLYFEVLLLLGDFIVSALDYERAFLTRPVNCQKPEAVAVEGLRKMVKHSHIDELGNDLDNGNYLAFIQFATTCAPSEPSKFQQQYGKNSPSGRLNNEKRDEIFEAMGPAGIRKVVDHILNMEEILQKDVLEAYAEHHYRLYEGYPNFVLYFVADFCKVAEPGDAYHLDHKVVSFFDSLLKPTSKGDISEVKKTLNNWIANCGGDEFVTRELTKAVLRKTTILRLNEYKPQAPTKYGGSGDKTQNLSDLAVAGVEIEPHERESFIDSLIGEETNWKTLRNYIQFHKGKTTIPENTYLTPVGEGQLGFFNGAMLLVSSDSDVTLEPSELLDNKKIMFCEHLSNHDTLFRFFLMLSTMKNQHKANDVRQKLATCLSNNPIEVAVFDQVNEHFNQAGYPNSNILGFLKDRGHFNFEDLKLAMSRQKMVQLTRQEKFDDINDTDFPILKDPVKYEAVGFLKDYFQEIGDIEDVDKLKNALNHLFNIEGIRNMSESKWDELVFQLLKDPKNLSLLKLFPRLIQLERLLFKYRERMIVLSAQNQGTEAEYFNFYTAFSIVNEYLRNELGLPSDVNKPPGSFVPNTYIGFKSKLPNTPYAGALGMTAEPILRRIRWAFRDWYDGAIPKGNDELATNMLLQAMMQHRGDDMLRLLTESELSATAAYIDDFKTFMFMVFFNLAQDENPELAEGRIDHIRLVLRRFYHCEAYMKAMEDRPKGEAPPTRTRGEYALNDRRGPLVPPAQPFTCSENILSAACYAVGQPFKRQKISQKVSIASSFAVPTAIKPQNYVEELLFHFADLIYKERKFQASVPDSDIIKYHYLERIKFKNEEVSKKFLESFALIASSYLSYDLNSDASKKFLSAILAYAMQE